MTNKENDAGGIDFLLSPKEMEDKRRRSLTLSRIDK
jgi:hypothetical protein